MIAPENVAALLAGTAHDGPVYLQDMVLPASPKLDGISTARMLDLPPSGMLFEIRGPSLATVLATRPAPMMAFINLPDGQQVALFAYRSALPPSPLRAVLTGDLNPDLDESISVTTAAGAEAQWPRASTIYRREQPELYAALLAKIQSVATADRPV